MENFTELEQMREQLNMLHKKLNEQEIINEALIRASIGRKVKSITRNTIFLVIGCIIGCTAFFMLHKLVNISLSLVIVTWLFFLVAIAYTVYSNSKVANNNLITNNLVKTRLNVLKFKKLEWQWLYFSIPFLFIWAPWFCWEIKTLVPDPEPLFVGGTIGGIIGLIWGIIMFRRNQRNANDIISEIEILQKESRAE